MSKPFHCFALTPAQLTSSKIAIAAARAEGIGLLDLEFSNIKELQQIERNSNQLLSATKVTDEIGLRLKASQILEHQNLLVAFAARNHWLIICDWSIESLPALLQKLPPSSSRQILIEIFSPDEALSINQQDIAISGLVAKGHEAGGWNSDTSAFILT